MLSIEATAETPLSERRLAANRANAQLSTGPRTEEGKARSSLNAVKTGLCGRAVLLADEAEARAYREHVQRVLTWWNPDNVEEHALVQALADTQWRLESIPGLESALYAQARLRGEPLLTHPTTQRLLLDAQAEVAEAKALKNLRLHERRLRRQLEKDKAELNALRKERFEREAQNRRAEAQRQQEEARRQQAEAERQRRQERAQKRAERRRANAEALRSAASPECRAEPDHRLNGFEFTTSDQTALTPLTIPRQER
jgi:hypothetical protein